MANEVDVPLSTAHAQSEIEALQQRLNQALATARELASSLSGGQGGPDARAQFMGSLSEIAGLKGAITGLQASATTGASGGATVASAAARQAVKSFAGWGLGPYAAPEQAIQIAQESGTQIDTSRYAAAGAGNLAASVVRQVQQQAMLSTAGTLPIGPYSSIADPAAAAYARNAYLVQQPLNAQPAPIGPSSSLAGAQVQANAYYFQQQAYNQRQQLMIRGAAGFAAANFAGSAISQYAQTAATGELDPMAMAGIYGGGIGAFAGGVGGMLATPTAPGAGFATGAMMGYMIGAPIAQANVAPFMRTRAMALSLSSVAARMRVSPYDLIQPASGDIQAALERRDVPTPGGMGGLGFLAQQLTERGKSPHEMALIRLGLYTGTDIVTGPALARTYSTYASAFMAAGEEPSQALRPSIVTSTMYGMAANDQAMRAAPLIAARNRMGRNNADLALQYGAEAYGAFADATGAPDLTSSQLAAIKREQLGGFRAARGALQVRGAGLAEETPLRERMAAIAELPGGRDSLTYAETRQRTLEAQRTRFGQEDITQFGLRDVQLHGMRDVLSAMPYAPGSRMELAGSIIRNDLQEIGRVRNRMTALRQRGELSEEDELRMTSQVWGLRRDYAQEIGQLSEGFMDRISGFSAGRVQGFGRASSMQQAAFMAGMSGWATRRYGAVTGGQQSAQDAIVGNLVGALSIPTSTTSNFNNGFGAGNQDLGTKLDRIANLLERNLQGPPDQRKRQTKGGINGRELPDDHGRDPDYN